MYRTITLPVRLCVCDCVCVCVSLMSEHVENSILKGTHRITEGTGGSAAGSTEVTEGTAAGISHIHEHTPITCGTNLLPTHSNLYLPTTVVGLPVFLLPHFTQRRCRQALWGLHNPVMLNRTPSGV